MQEAPGPFGARGLLLEVLLLSYLLASTSRRTPGATIDQLCRLILIRGGRLHNRLMFHPTLTSQPIATACADVFAAKEGGQNEHCRLCILDFALPEWHCVFVV